MRKCPYCKINVGGDLEKCPLCQSKLSGEAEEAYFPKFESMQKRTMFYKFQLLIVWVIVIVAIGLDFMLKIRLHGYPDLHWSLLLGMWILITDLRIMRSFRPGTGSARKMTLMVFITLVMLLITAYFLGFMELTLGLIVPIIITGMVIANFVLSMIDKHGNTMSYLLTGILIGLIPCIVMYLINKSMSIAWVVCALVSAILLVGAVVFKGRAVAAELQRRFNL